MARGIGEFTCPVARAGDDPPSRIDQHGTHGHLAPEGCCLCFGESYIHMAEERRHVPR